MRKFLIYFSLFTLHFSLLVSCSNQETPSVSTGVVAITLTGIDDDLSGLDVQLRNISTGSVFVDTTDKQGTASFSVTPGLYEASASQTRFGTGNEYYSYNGMSGQITVLKDRQTTAAITMKRAVISRLVIKEL